MKSIWLSTIATLFFFPAIEKNHQSPIFQVASRPVQNIFIITIDGYRWQEVFTGADPQLINDKKFCDDAATMSMMYAALSPDERRKKLMPFFWNVIASKGVLYGNRQYGNKVNVANPYALSYPGYSEMLTGTVDISISSNKKRNNPNKNILEYLSTIKDFKDSVAVFASWNVFPYIFNAANNSLPVNSGYEKRDVENSTVQFLQRAEEMVEEKEDTRYDDLTFLLAKEYVKKHKPRVLFLGFGETDEFAHQGRYDAYLQKANSIDKMIGDLWYLIQTTHGYRNNTVFLITTDHGRGNKKNRWTSHGSFISGSSQTWLAAIGPGIPAYGEMKEENQFHQQQLAETVASILGQQFLITR